MPSKITSGKGARAARAKSTKADGTPKNRWSSADRAARGHSPRRGGGLPRSTRTRDDAPFDRDASSESRSRTGGPERSSGPRRDADDRESRPNRSNGFVDRRSDAGADRRTDGARRDDAGRGRSGAKTYGRRDSATASRPTTTWGDRKEGTEARRSSSYADRKAAYGERPTSSSRGKVSNGYGNRPATTDRAPRYEDRAPRYDRDERAPREERAPRYEDRAPRYDDRAPREDRAPRYEDRRSGSSDRPARSGEERPRFGDRPSNTYSDRSDSRPSRRSSSDHQRPARSADFTPRTSTVLSRQDRPVRSASTPDTEPQAAMTPAPVAGDFASLGLPASMVSTLQAQGITAPFPIQAATIPDALQGRDILGRGQTGSGKTLAFGLPMIAQLAGADSSKPRGLILVPTRELAMQVVEALTPLVRTAGLKIILVAGGMSYTPQLRAFSSGVDIVVATPGRLIDLMEQRAVDLTRVEVTVLDEADHMADLGFMPAVTQILDEVPSGGQRMLFSATLDGAIDRLVRKYLQSPLTHEVDSDQASVTTMAHHVLHIAPKDKVVLTGEIASREGRTLIFVRTQRGADRVAEQLRGIGVTAGALHGGLAQGARTRILEAFKSGQVPVLVATDVAARGIHVDDIGLVLQADPPGGPKEYLHRAGRTARAGGTGVVVTLVLPHQRREINSLTSQAGVRPIALPAQSGDTEMVAATGAQQPTGAPISEADYQRIISPPARRRPNGGERPRGRGGRDGGRSFNNGSRGGGDGERRAQRTQRRAYSA